MDPVGIAVIIVVGLAVVTYGVLTDRRKTRERNEELLSPPKRDIPRFAPDNEPPEYLTELQASRKPDSAPDTTLDEATRTEYRDARDTATQFPEGYPRHAFITDRKTAWAVARHPLILICRDEVLTVRELLPALERAQLAGRPLVLITPDMPDEAINTLSANAVQGKVQCLPILLTGQDNHAAIAELTGATALEHADLVAGYLPEHAFGTCRAWIADEDNSWLLT